MHRIGAAVLLTVVLTAGCGVQSGTTDLERARIGLDSVDGRVGDLRLLSVSIASPGPRGSTHLAGDTAALLLTVANDGQDDDVLTGAETAVAEKVVFRDGDGAAEERLDVAVPAGGVAVLREVTGAHLELTQLRETLRSGFSVPVTFEFRDAGAVTLSVPIRTYEGVRPDRLVEHSS
ncbi:copper chaperone PCu(A)C [Petropleomorpha daqingensis]|uniref:Copper(I)-binding protein n=1 Tax=Petropleomorpha daqingensis TaxID=2026353 RepID=A0A853CFU9_9ACTN|nr:copper chaperone PCu(A)C [Petropleomorpha daqingensis]NYJ05442.1 copper(I)-binding protein [Petropleomorpha daqingensis]